MKLSAASFVLLQQQLGYLKLAARIKNSGDARFKREPQ
jgi:hypothetical protein